MNFSNRFKIPYKLLTPEKTICPMTKLVWYIQHTLETEEMLSVTDLWVNQKTYDKLREIFESFIGLHVKGKTRVRKELSWYLLDVAPACDIKNEHDLEDDYIYIYI